MKFPKILSVAFGVLFLTHAVWAQTLGTTNLVEGPTAGSDSVVLAASGAWTATTNATWLHLSAANQSGTGSTNVIFTFDANAGATRTGTLTIAGQTVNVTQAGSTYVASKQVPLVSSGLNQPCGVAVDGAGNIYIADTFNNEIKEWNVVSNTVTTLVSSGLNQPNGVAVDGVGNVYIADTGNNAIKEWVAASNIVTTLASVGSPYGVAVDGSGNVYIAITFGNMIKEWVAKSNIVTTLVSVGIQNPYGVAVDGAGNVYIEDWGNNAIKEWVAASNTVTTFVILQLYGVSMTGANGIAVDSVGNVYSSTTAGVWKWTVANNTPVPKSVAGPCYSVALDGAGNLYFVNLSKNAIYELLSHTFMDATAKVEPAAGGSDSLPAVLPATANLTGPFAPVSDSAWLTLSGVTNGVVSFAFTTNYSINRTAHISLLGQKIAVTQPAVVPPVLNGFTTLNNGAFQFGFTNNQGVSFTVWSTTNLALPLTNWTVLASLTNDGSGQFQFTDPLATNNVQQFYRVTSP